MTFYFNMNRVIITIGSIIVPALLSIQRFDSPDVTPLSIGIYWSTWILSLCVTISNGVLTLFKLDKKYYLLHTSYEQMKSEGWQFLALTGHYKPQQHHGVEEQVTHETQFKYFTQTVERIYMRQMEEEYIKLQDINTGPVSSRTPIAVGRKNSTSYPSSDIPVLMDYQARTPGQNDIVMRIATAVGNQLRKEENLPTSIEGPSPTSNENTKTEEDSSETGAFVPPDWRPSPMSM
jgi:hypothetical protein